MIENLLRPQNYLEWDHRRRRKAPVLRASAIATAFVVTVLAVSRVWGQGLPPVAEIGATLTRADGGGYKLVARHSNFQPIEISAGETVRIELRVPSTMGEAILDVYPMDGGVVAVDPTSRGATTKVSFRCGALPGLYRVAVTIRQRSAILQFVVPQSEGGRP
jgi:hypothetical protein